MIVLYDGTCGFCHGTVRWVLARDPGGSIRFAPLQGGLAREALRQLPGLDGVDSVIVLHPAGAWVRSTAVLELCRYVGGGWRLLLAGYLLPRRLRDWLYDQFAKRRFALFARLDSCPIPSPEERERFLLD